MESDFLKKIRIRCYEIGCLCLSPTVGHWQRRYGGVVALDLEPAVADLWQHRSVIAMPRVSNLEQQTKM
jgi:hypothetical protein